MDLPDFLTRHPHGEVRLAGHRIGLFHVVERYKEGQSAEAIAQHYPSVPLLLVYKALVYYLEHREEVDRYVTECRAEIDRQAAARQPGPDLNELRRRLEAEGHAEAN
jgi:uncharacterized protein (DUF433 family)